MGDNGIVLIKTFLIVRFNPSPLERGRGEVQQHINAFTNKQRIKFISLVPKQHSARHNLRWVNQHV